MKTNAFKSWRRNFWSVFTAVAGLSLLPPAPGVMAAGLRTPQDKVPEKNQLEFTFQGKVDRSFLVLGSRAVEHRTKTEWVVKMVSGAIKT